MAGFTGLFFPIDHGGVHSLALIDLEGKSVEGSVIEERREAVLFGPVPRVGVDEHRVLVRIVGFEVGRHRALLRRGLAVGGKVGRAVFFAEIPDEGEVVTEAGNEFAVVKLAKASGVTIVEHALVFGFLGDHVEHYAASRHVLKHELPLVEFAAIEAVEGLLIDVGPDVFAVAADVHGEEVGHVHAGVGEVVEPADEAFAFAVLPGGIAGTPVGDVSGVGVEFGFGCGFAFAGITVIAIGAVEIGEGEEVFGTVGAALEEVIIGVLVAKKSAIGHDSTMSPKVPASGGGRRHGERASGVR